ncbi:MAG: hypothetical protein QE263_08955 [Vampirovibrionales bacterium]|nr:hypothetical protein [Vampirovibrionales bacterium]
MTLRVFLLEDERLWQQGVGQLLATVPGVELVGMANDAEDGWIQCQALMPDVVLLDWNVKGLYTGDWLGQKLLDAGHASDCLAMVSGADPAMLPPIPYRLIPKPQLGRLLVPYLEGCIASKT